MKTAKRKMWMGVVLFALGMGCGTVDGSVGTNLLAVTGSDVAGEQLALPDGDGAGARDRAGRVAKSELSRLDELLGLSDDQVAQIQPILDATRTTLEGIRAQVKAGTLSRDDAKAQVKAAHDQQNAQILALLTADQQVKFKAMREHHCHPFDIDRMTKELGLSADQVTQIGALMKAAQDKITEIHTQVEAGTVTVEDGHAQVDKVRQDTEAAIKALLTADQVAKLEARRAGRPGPDGDGREGGEGGERLPPPPPPPTK